MAQNINLLSTTSSMVETPYIVVTIGKYTFGAYSKNSTLKSDGMGAYVLNKVQYPNYIQRLHIQKVNGIVNKYTLELAYAITPNDDPNFFEKVFSSVSKTRKITFTYGDLSAPAFVYRGEEAMITKVTHKLNALSSVLTYTVSAVSAAAKVSIGSYTFDSTYAKPSDVIKRLLYNGPKYGLLDVFPGMSDKGLVLQEGLIASDDVKVKLEKKTNMSVLDYLSYLVSKMKSSATFGVTKAENYAITFIDDTTGKFNGPYFKVSKFSKAKTMSTAYEIDVGFPSQNAIISYDCEDNETYAIYYDYAKSLQQEEYVQRIDDEGNIQEVYAPIIVSGTRTRQASEANPQWWSQVTEFPVKVRITIRGLLRSALLMTHVRLNVYFWGQKYADSGLFVITKQEDDISTSGYQTTLTLLRIGGDE